MNIIKQIFVPVIGLLSFSVQAFSQNTPWSTTGNIGIGTTLPNRLLAVNGAIISWNSSDVPGQGGLSLGDNGGHYWGFRRTATGSHLAIDAWNGTANVEHLRILSNNGNVGIGTTTPSQKLEVNGNIKASGFILPTDAAAGKVLTSDASGNATWQTASGSSSGWALGGNTTGGATVIGNIDNQDLRIITYGEERIRVLGNGKTVIGKPNNFPTDALLAVYGNIYSTKVKVTQTGWADYVFHQDYHLRPLTEVEQYIRQHNHLPEVPSAEEVKKEGLDLGDNQAVLLKKIEELTLYLIEQNKKLEEQSRKMERQQDAIEALKKQVQQGK